MSADKKRFKNNWCHGGENWEGFFSGKKRSAETILPHIDVPPHQGTKINFEGGRPYVRRRDQSFE